MAAAMRVVSIVIGILAMIIPASVLGVTGLNVEGLHSILRQVDDVGARTITIVAGNEVAIPPSAVERIARLAGVDWVIGLGPVFDARRSQPGGLPTPVRAYRAVGAPVEFGNQNRKSGAFVSVGSAQRLALAGAYSILEPGAIPVVGWFRADEPLHTLEVFVLVPSSDDRLGLERIIISVEEAGWVDVVAGHLALMVGTNAGGVMSVERSPVLLEAREAVREEVTRKDRLLVVAILGVGMALAGIVVSAGTIAGRRDFGRRRALGATRGQLTSLVMLGALWPALAGAAIGTPIGWLYLTSRLGYIPDWQFPTSIGVLTVLVLVVASAIPASIAATRDPLRVLRVP